MKCKRYLNFIRSYRCIVCAAGDVDAHHVHTRGAGGSDLLAVPLCREHHSEIHTQGVFTFQKKYNFDFRDAHIGLLQRYIENMETKNWDLDKLN